MTVLESLVRLRAMAPSDAETLWRWDNDRDRYATPNPRPAAPSWTIYLGEKQCWGR
jgi:hypothetical protein